MIKVNWKELKKVNVTLEKQGFRRDTPVTIHIYTLSKENNTHVKTSTNIKFVEWRKKLFEAETNKLVTSIVVMDNTLKVLWKTQNQISYNEIIPTGGHSRVVKEFSGMEKNQKEVWLKLMESSMIDTLNNEFYDRKEN